MDSKLIKNLLQKYLDGTCTPAEAEIIETWLKEGENSHPQYFNDEFINEQIAYNKAEIDRRLNTSKIGTTRSVSWRWLKVAASLLLILASTVLLKSRYLDRPGKENLQAGVKKYIINGWAYVQTPKGHMATISLPDGSVINLNASSRLRYPVKFSNHKRPVYLDEGEALFNVAKDKTSPFTVYTQKFATTALGTAFNIRSYSNEKKVSISLIHGKIQVDDLHTAVKQQMRKILLPHEQLLFARPTGQLTKTKFSDELPVTSWKDGILTFKDATTDEVINAVQNRFNVQIKNNSRVSAWSYTGTFTNESLYDVLKTITLTEGISFKTDGDIVTLN